MNNSPETQTNFFNIFFFILSSFTSFLMPLRFDAQSSVRVPAEPNHGRRAALAAVRWFPNGLNV
jgi:hypothetical protein